MRASMLALAGILVCAASAASAQTVIDVESQRATEPPVGDQPVAQPQPPPTPKVENPVQPKDDGPAAPAGRSRFTFNPIDNGFLRLDTQSGQVAYCRSQTAGWSCQAVPENRADLESDMTRLRADVTALKALKSEIARLEEEITSLRKDVAALRDPPPPRPPAEMAPADKGPDVTIRLPTQEDVARARAFIERTWHRLVEMIIAAQKDMMQKS